MARLLGQHTDYPDRYAPEVLEPIPRAAGRKVWGGCEGIPPFSGVDYWTCYEVSWLQPHGVPTAFMATCTIPSDSPNLVESKSFKLYLNSLNFETFATPEAFCAVVTRDISAVVGAPVDFQLISLDEAPAPAKVLTAGVCLDSRQPLLPIPDHPDARLLQPRSERCVEVSWYSHLLRSNCPVTQQPDWGSIYLHYRGPELDPDQVLTYWLSFRRHNDFHEQCLERMCHDFRTQTGSRTYALTARYTRRGGLDINPLRSEGLPLIPVARTARQ